MRLTFAILLFITVFLNSCSHQPSPKTGNVTGIWTAVDSSVVLVVQQPDSDTTVTGFAFIKVEGPKTQVRDSVPIKGSYHDNQLGLTFYQVGGNLFPFGFIIGTYSTGRKTMVCTIRNMVQNIGWQTELEYRGKKY